MTLSAQFGDLAISSGGKAHTTDIAGKSFWGPGVKNIEKEAQERWQD